MSQQYNEQILKEWAEAQKRLWEGFSTVLPAVKSVPGMNWWQSYLKNLSFWETTVKQTLKTEASLMEQWMQQIISQKSETDPSVDWARRMEGVMRHWLRCQAQLWDECFAMLRGGEINPQITSRYLQTDSTEGTGDPEDAWEDSTVPDADCADAAENVEPDADFTDLVENAEPLPEQVAVAAAETPAEPVATPYSPDDLKTIAGIGPALEKKLNEQGIISYRQLAELNPQEIQHLETTVIKFPGRIRRDRWIEQAKEHHLHKYGEWL
jgi:predicted flap endonuclease-1-like 5' DNA nuclease